MSIILSKDLRNLIEVQSMDSTIDILRSRISEIPAKIQSLKDFIEKEKQAAASFKTETVRLQVLRKDKELEAGELDNLIIKHQKELNLLKSNEVFKALLLETERAKNNKDALETEILEILDKIDAVSAEEKKNQREFTEKEKRTAGEIAELEKLKVALEAELKGLEEARAAFAARFPAEILSRYEYLRIQRKGIAVVEVKGGGSACGGCNMSLTPQAKIDVKKKDVLVFCETCQRIIYSLATIGEPAEAGPAARQDNPATE
ncbi:MAG: C4-type zinc ribbon domain-containing protein [bacterium]